MQRRRYAPGLLFVAVLALTAISTNLVSLRGEEPTDLSKIAPEVLTKEQRTEAVGMIDRDITRRTTEFNAHNREQWEKITTRAQWEKYRDERIEKLRRSLGDLTPPAKVNSRVTGTVEGDGFKIENVVYESRPGQWVTGNLYGPAKPGKAMPGILIAHAHHLPKQERELQDMGMTWARAGCLVLVIDQVGYGERRAHPFKSAADYPKMFRPSRQDYFFRYDSGAQLQLLGDSLMGWFVQDLSRGVDLLLARPGIDPKKIILLGGVAGGGDPAGVTAALDPRIACCVPFNFGGPQPETRYPLPDDAETRFNYLGGTYWDSTRGLRRGAIDEFPHWVIVASTAPRALIHAHEFSWDRDRDPVWKRYQKVWGDFYGAADHLGAATGKGTIKQSAPEGSHCNNIGKFHRKMIHPLFDRWFGIKVTEADEYSAPRKTDDLICFTEAARQEIKPKSLLDVMSSIGTERMEKARQRLAGKSADERVTILRTDWAKLLGPISPAKPPVVQGRTTDEQPVSGVKIERVVLEVEPGIVVPVVVLVPSKLAGKAPVVVGLARTGKAGFLKERAAELLALTQGGAIVVLPDVRGTGETRSGSSRGRDSHDTNLSTHEQLFGETLLGQRLRDLRSVLGWVRSRPDVDVKRVALWGDSFRAPNTPETNFNVPHAVEGQPQGPEPLGGLLALLGALFEEVQAVHIAGGLIGYHGVLTHFAVLVGHDDTVPGALTTGDLCDLAGSLAPRPLRLEAMVDHLNRPVSAAEVRKVYAPTVQGYATAPDRFSLSNQRTSAATWLLERLK